MRVPQYVSDYVSTLNDHDARVMLKRLLTKSLKQQREAKDVTTASVSSVEWHPKVPVNCSRCSTRVHSYSTTTITTAHTKSTLLYCKQCHDEHWSWL